MSVPNIKVSNTRIAASRIAAEYFNHPSKKLNVIDGSIQSKERDVPEYIQLDGKNKSVKLVRVPKFSEVPYPVIMEPSLVIEYYSR